MFVTKNGKPVVHTRSDGVQQWWQRLNRTDRRISVSRCAGFRPAISFHIAHIVNAAGPEFVQASIFSASIFSLSIGSVKLPILPDATVHANLDVVVINAGHALVAAAPTHIEIATAILR